MSLNIKDVALLAANEIEPTEHTTPSEWLLWFRLRDLYRSFKNGTVSKELGETKKAAIIRQFHLDHSELSSAKRIMQHNADMWARIESASRQYAQNRTTDNADLFVEAVYGCKLKEGNE